MINNFSDFCNELLKCGFSMGGGNAKGIYAVIPYDWKTQESVDSPVKWHTGDPEEWYPYFYAVRRKGETFEEAYENGTISQMAKRIYDIISGGEIAFHEIKQIGGIRREDNSKFERAIVELQMRMFITMCGRAQKINKYGEAYGWNSTVFTTTEDFWEKRGVFLPDLNPEESYDRITTHILELNPDAERKVMDKFIR